jgi:hypothetical protein
MADTMTAPPPTDGNPNATLTGADFTAGGVLKTTADELALVVQSAANAKAYFHHRQWSLLWRDADLTVSIAPPDDGVREHLRS